jgi:serine/threonine-protein kinase
MLPVVDALRLTRQVAGSMAAAHAAGIVHRDLKPDNLVVVRDPAAPGGERPKILDFGIAKLGDQIAGRTKTRTGSLLGTPVYMSPEQCDGRVDVDHRADIYSLGCVLFYLLTGRPPFDRPGPGPTMLAHMSEPAPAPSSVAGTLPRALDDLVLRCLAKAPADRYGSMLELQRGCDEMLARAHALPSFTAASELPPASSRRGLWIALGGFAVALAVGIGFAIAMSGGVAAHAPAASVAAPVSAPAVTLPTQAMTVTQPPAAPSAPAVAPVPAPAPPSSAATVTRPAAPKHAQKHAPHPKPDPATDPNDDVYGDR